MKSKISLWLELGVVALVVSTLAGCFGDGAAPNYDGNWTAGYADSAFVPPASIGGATVSCGVSGVLPTITLVNGVGSATQWNRCDQVTAASGVIASQGYVYLISVAVNTTTGAVNAIVNGGTLTGQCISANGCSAQNGTASLSLTR